MPDQTFFSHKRLGGRGCSGTRDICFSAWTGGGRDRLSGPQKRQWAPGPEQDQATAACHPALRKGGGVAHGIRAGTLLPVLPAFHPARLEADGTWEHLAEPGMGPPFVMTSTNGHLVAGLYPAVSPLVLAW